MSDFLSDAPRRLLDAYAAGARRGYGAICTDWRGQESRDYLGASKAGDCRRKMWFSFSPEFDGEPLTDEKALLFSDGYLLEADTRARLNAGQCVTGAEQFEVVHPDEPRIRGHIDGLVYPADDPIALTFAGVCYIFEHKAMRDFPFSKLIGKKGMKNGTPMENVAEEHPAGFILNSGTVQVTNAQYWDQVQALMLLRLLSTMKINHVDLGEQRCLFVARHKETGKLAVEEISSDYHRGGEIVDRMRSVLADFDAGRVSPKDYDPHSKDWQCQYCEFRRDCMSIGDAVRIETPDEQKATHA